MNSRALYPAIMLLSAMGIAYQIALTRVFSIGQWHHFAYMIISIAMLGLGASGTVWSLARERIRGREAAVLRVCAFLGAVSFAVCYALSQQVPFETYQITTQPSQVWYLLLLYLILSIPFFLEASCVALGFFIASRNIGRLYFYNMFGAGLGALGVIGLLFIQPPAMIPYWLTAGGAVAYLILCAGPWRQFVMRAIPLAVVLAIVFAAGVTPVRMSEYKELSYTLDFPDATIEAEAYSPLSQVTAVSSELIRETPGQISNYPMGELGALPEQIGLFFDGGAVSPVNRFDGDLDRFQWLDYVTGALPYRLVENPSVLVLGAGGGMDVLQGLSLGAEHVTAVEVDPGVFRLMGEEFREFSGGLYERPDVDAVLAEGRGYLQANPDAEFDLIQVPLFGSFSTAAAGVYSLNESFVYTVEAVSLYMDRLSEDGVLALTCWLKTPPRDAIKLFATAAEALEYRGVENPEDHLAFIRSWNNATIVAAREPMDEADVAALRTFAEERFLDLDYYPGMDPGDATQFTQLDEPYYVEAAQAILSEGREDYYREYLFHVRPATDDQPYFFRFLKLSAMPQILEDLGAQWVNFVEWGYVVLVATIGQGILAGAVLILLPLIALARRPGVKGARRWTLLYFACLGLSFMFLEIGFIQTFMLFLAYPVYAMAVVLTAFLVFSGLGSLTAGSLPWPAPRIVAVSVAGIAVFAVAYLFLLPVLYTVGAGWSDPVKIAASIALLAPLSFCMGMPFPAGMQLVSDRADNLVPWAWGINGCLSVTGATLAAFTAVHLGFQMVVLIAVGIYIAAALVIVRLDANLAAPR